MATLSTSGGQMYREIRRSPMLPRTPYIYFLKQRRADYLELEFNDVVPILYKEWAEMSEENKAKWREAAQIHMLSK